MAADEAYSLNPQLDVVVYNEDEVHIRQGTWADWTLTLHDDERRGIVGRVFAEMLVGSATTDDLLATPGIDGRVSRDELEAFLADLGSSGIVLAARDASQTDGQRRHLIGPAGPGRRHDRASSVTVVGDGSSSALLASYLAEAGVTVESLALPGNGVPNTPGGLPSDPPATARRLDGAPRDALEAAWGASDLLVVALESLSPTVLTAANSVALHRGVPWVSAYSDGPLVVVGPIYVPGETGCYAELEAQLLSVCSHRAELKAYWDALGTRTAARRTPRWQGGLAASWLVEPVVAFLESGTSDLIGRATVFDVGQRRVERVRCLTLPRCPVCRSDRGGYNPWD